MYSIITGIYAVIGFFQGRFGDHINGEEMDGKGRVPCEDQSFCPKLPVYFCAIDGFRKYLEPCMILQRECRVHVEKLITKTNIHFTF
jgi:hypothetical protein